MVQNAFFHMDVHSTGRVNAVEFFRFIYIMRWDISSRVIGLKVIFLGTCAPFAYSYSSRDPPGPDLVPSAIQMRNAIFAAVCTNCKYALCYQDYLHFFTTFRKNPTEDQRKYSTIMPPLDGLNLTRKVLSSTIEKYLLARKEGKYERESSTRAIQLSRANAAAPKVVPTMRDDNQSRQGGDEVICFDDCSHSHEEEVADRSSTDAALSWFGGKGQKYTVGLNGEVVEHDECCMCGCRERLYA